MADREWGRSRLLPKVRKLPLPSPAAAAPKTSGEKTTHAHMAAGTHSVAANEIAVCACGTVFVPNAKIQYVEFGGKKYACCTDECHKMAEENTAKVTVQLNPPKSN